MPVAAWAGKQVLPVEQASPVAQCFKYSLLVCEKLSLCPLTKLHTIYC